VVSVASHLAAIARSGSVFIEYVFDGDYMFLIADALPQDFFLPSEAFDLIFLKAKIAILCTKGFEIMDLTEYVSLSNILGCPIESRFLA
jgi:hypothetical protein